MMINWNNLDTIASYEELKKVAHVDLAKVMTGANGAERVKKYKNLKLFTMERLLIQVKNVVYFII